MTKELYASAKGSNDSNNEYNRNRLPEIVRLPESAVLGDVIVKVNQLIDALAALGTANVSSLSSDSSESSTSSESSSSITV